MKSLVCRKETGMEKKRLEIKDAEIPQIVRNKIDLAYSKIQSEQEKRTMKTTFIPTALKRTMAIAACIAVCLCSFSAYNRFMIGSKEDTSFPDPFTIKVLAAELSENTPQPISIGDVASNSWVFGGDERDYSVNYCINLPLSCEGENIKSVTYTVNKGTFQIVEPADDPYVIDGIPFDGSADFGEIGGFYDEACDHEDTRPTNQLLLTSFTVDYDKQMSPEFWSNVCRNCPDMKETFDLIWNSDSEEDFAKAVNQLLSDIVITVTANYQDGSTSSKTIGLEAEIVEIEPLEKNDGTSIDKEVQVFVIEL